MSTRKSDLEAMAAELATNGGRRGTARVTARPAAIPPRVRPVRLSVDLGPVPYQELRAWCDARAAETGVLKVSHTDVIRLMVDELLHDPAVSDRLAALVRERVQVAAQDGRRPGQEL